MIYDLQKASMLKRISAAILDGILLCIFITGFAYLVAKITNFDTYNQRLDGYYTQYAEEYGIDFNISEEDYNKLTTQQQQRYNDAIKAMNADDDASYTYTMVVSLTLLIASLGILLSYLLLEFIVPLLLKNGQTVGKKVFGIGLMRTDGVRLNSALLFIRTFLGKFTLETMIPVLIVLLVFFGQLGRTGTIVLLGLGALQLGILIATRTNSLIHDLLAKSVAVDLASQMIFDTEADLIAYKEKLAAEKAAQREY